MGQVQHITTGAPLGATREDQVETKRVRMLGGKGEPDAQTRADRLALIDEWRGLQGLRELSFWQRLRVR